MQNLVCTLLTSSNWEPRFVPGHGEVSVLCQHLFSDFFFFSYARMSRKGQFLREKRNALAPGRGSARFGVTFVASVFSSIKWQ